MMLQKVTSSRIDTRALVLFCIILYWLTFSITAQAEPIKSDHALTYQVYSSTTSVYLEKVNTEVAVNPFAIHLLGSIHSWLIVVSKENFIALNSPAFFVNAYQHNCFYIIRRSKAP